MNIEILLTEAEIATEFAEALEARDLPEKFFYWFPISAQRWQNLVSDPAYAELTNAWTAVSGRVPELTQHFGAEVPVVSYGAGDGLKDRLILHAVRAVHKRARYYPVDASQTLLEIACSGAEDDEFDVVGIKADISSRMHILLAADSAEAPRLFLMAGNTLGGFDPLDQIKNVASCMREGDRLIIDGELDSEASKELAMTDAARNFAFAPLASVGLCPEDGRIRFEQKKDSRHAGLSMLSKYFQADRDLRISISGQEVAVARGERIFMNFRYLYSPAAFQWLLENHGSLEVNETFYSTDGRFVTAICSK